MVRTIPRKRPWLAALLGALATGLGHLYLRRWRRAVGWLALLIAASILFVDPSGSIVPVGWFATDPLASAPILVVAGLSTADAYLLARAHNAVARLTQRSDGQLTHCPTCGKELDPELSFCHWCTTTVGEPAPSGPSDRQE